MPSDKWPVFATLSNTSENFAGVVNSTLTTPSTISNDAYSAILLAALLILEQSSLKPNVKSKSALPNTVSTSKFQVKLICSSVHVAISDGLGRLLRTASNPPNWIFLSAYNGWPSMLIDLIAVSNEVIEMFVKFSVIVSCKSSLVKSTAFAKSFTLSIPIWSTTFTKLSTPTLLITVLTSSFSIDTLLNTSMIVSMSTEVRKLTAWSAVAVITMSLTSLSISNSLITSTTTDLSSNRLTTSATSSKFKLISFSLAFVTKVSTLLLMSVEVNPGTSVKPAWSTAVSIAEVKSALIPA